MAQVRCVRAPAVPAQPIPRKYKLPQGEPSPKSGACELPLPQHSPSPASTSPRGVNCRPSPVRASSRGVPRHAGRVARVVRGCGAPPLPPPAARLRRAPRAKALRCYSLPGSNSSVAKNLGVGHLPACTAHTSGRRRSSAGYPHTKHRWYSTVAQAPGRARWRVAGAGRQSPVSILNVD